MSDIPLHIVEYYRNADSFGYSILALFVATTSGPRAMSTPRDHDVWWGVMDALVATSEGWGTRYEVVQKFALDDDLVDWFRTEKEARTFFEECKSRSW